MRKSVMAILFIGILCLWLGAGYLSNQLFEAANQRYEKGEYDKALAIYLKMLDQGSHWKLFYNIGNCYFKKGEFIKAKIFYLRSEKLRPFDRSIRLNIDIVDRQFQGRIPERKIDFITRLKRKIETVIPLNTLSIILVFLVLLTHFFIFLLIKRGWKRGLIYGLSFSLLLTLMIFIYHIHRVSQTHIRDTAVVISDNVELHSGPGTQHTVLFKLSPGIEVKILDRSRNWLQISVSAEIAGWIQEECLETI